jgi:probable HAF family extracellular repeat protein
MKTGFARMAAIFAALAGAATIASAQLPTYRVEMLPVPAEAGYGAYALGLNSLGDVVGVMSGPGIGTRAVTWSGAAHALTVLPAGRPGSQPTFHASAINDSGAVVGEFDVFVVTWLATPLRWPSSISAPLTLPSLGRRSASPVAINNAGQVVGGTWYPQARALLWSPTDAVQDLGTLVQSRLAWSAAVGINDAGSVAGTSGTSNGPSQAFVWTVGEGMRALAALPGSSASAAFGINAAGEVIGRALYSGQPWHFVRWSGTDATDLGPLTIGIDASQSNIVGINAAGSVVGYFESAAGPHGYLLTREGTLTDLAERIDPADPLKSAFTSGVFYVQAINDHGVIAGTFGLNPDVRPFVLVPQ